MSDGGPPIQEDDAYRRIHNRRREQMFQAEKRRQAAMSDDPRVLEPVSECPRRVGFHFIPHTESEDLRLTSALVCEENQMPFMRSDGSKCYACPLCAMEVEFEVADVLAKASLQSLKTFRKNLKPRRKFKWPWEKWFRGRKAEVPSET